MRTASSVEVRSKFGASSPIEMGPMRSSSTKRETGRGSRGAGPGIKNLGSGAWKQALRQALHHVEPYHHGHQEQDHHEADLADDLLQAHGQVAADDPLDREDEDLAAV